MNNMNVRRLVDVGRVKAKFAARDENVGISPDYFFKNALNKSIGSGRKVVVLCSLAISRMVWR